jgi:hypothetical protein
MVESHKYDTYCKPKQRFQPITTLKCLKQADPEEKYKDRKSTSQSKAFHGVPPPFATVPFSVAYRSAAARPK